MMLIPYSRSRLRGKSQNVSEHAALLILVKERAAELLTFFGRTAVAVEPASELRRRSGFAAKTLARKIVLKSQDCLCDQWF